MGMNGCYDGGECIQWHVCCPGSCRVRERVNTLCSPEHESEDTVAPHRRYNGEETQVIDTGSIADIYRDTEMINAESIITGDQIAAASVIMFPEGQPTQIIGTVEPNTMDFRTFQFREDLSMTEEEIQQLRDRFDAANLRAANMWIPTAPLEVEPLEEAQPIGSEYTRTYPRHRCLVCWIVSKLPNHHLCPHGRLVCEGCELEAAGW